MGCPSPTVSHRKKYKYVIRGDDLEMMRGIIDEIETQEINETAIAQAEVKETHDDKFKRLVGEFLGQGLSIDGTASKKQVMLWIFRNGLGTPHGIARMLWGEMSDDEKECIDDLDRRVKK